MNQIDIYFLFKFPLIRNNFIKISIVPSVRDRSGYAFPSGKDLSGEPGPQGTAKKSPTPPHPLPPPLPNYRHGERIQFTIVQ